MSSVVRLMLEIMSLLYGNIEKVYYHQENIGLKMVACVLHMVENGKRLRQFERCDNMKEKFESILKEHGIYGEDVEEILYAVNEMLTYAADSMKEKYPFARNSIDRLEKAAYEVFSLANDLE